MPGAVNIDSRTLATLDAWGPGSKQFCLQEPVTVTPDKIVLMAPLALSTGRSPM